MAKKSEILNEIHNRINESITGGSAVSKDFGLKKVINECLSVGAPEVIHILQQADSALSEGVEEKLLIRPLLEGLSRYESLFDVLKKNCDSMRLTINENLDDINLAELYESIENDSIKNFIGSIYKDYCNNKNLDNRAKLVSVLESVSAYDKNAGKLMAYVKDGVIKNDNVTYLNPFVNESVNESKVIDYNGQKFVQDEDGRLHAVNATDIKKIYENVDEYINQRIEESKAEKELQESKTYRTVDNGIHLYEHVRKLQQKYPENVKLQEILSEYASALQAGCREEMLYETFCARMKGGFDYLDAVEESVGLIQAEVAKNKPCIDLVKMLEMMSNTKWSYLVPIIESVVCDYMENPNLQTKNILLNHVRMYEFCPYIVDMILAVNNDTNNCVGNTLPESLGTKDVNKLITQHAHTESVFSPVQYVKENECIFNVSNQFFVRKGQNITKLSKDAIKNLSENFVALSILVNDPHVEINEAENKIYYYTAEKMFEISESLVKIDDKFYNLDELKNLSEMRIKYPEMEDVSILTAAFLLENFQNIAKIDFVTRIAMNENNNKTLDLFRIKNNIFVYSHDNVNEEHTYYRNVTALQLKNIINEHFGMKVSNLFEDLMPNQDKIVNELNELRHEHENKISSLLEMRQEFQTLYENAESENDRKELESKVNELDVLIKEAKDDYKKFQKKADEIENGKDSDNDSAPVLNEAKPKNKKKKSNKKIEEDEDEDFEFEEKPEDADDEEDGSDFNYEFDEEDGSDFDYEFDEEDGSEYIDDDEFTTSDGDDMTQSIEGTESFETDPFDEEDGSDYDFSANNSQDDDYNIEDETGVDEFGQPLEDVDIEDDSVIGAEEDPYGAGDNVPEDTDVDLENGDNGVEDAVTGEPETRTEDTADDADLDYANFKIVKVDFDINVRTGEKRSTGKVIVVVPWIDEVGNKTSETKTVPFYVTDIKGEKGVVLNSTGMSVEMYNAIVSAIKGSSDFEETDAENQDTQDSEVEPTPVDDMKDFSPMEDDEFGEPFDSGSDETTVLTVDDGIEPKGIQIPTYSEGDTDIEVPADNVNFSGNDSPVIDIIGETAKYDAKKQMEESFNHLFENEDENEPDFEENNSDVKLVTAEQQTDPIAVIEDVLRTFENEISEDEENDIDVEVGEIEDYDIDGTDVSSIKATIGENEYAFFSLDDKVYSCLAEDFDNYSEEIDTLREFVESEDENLAVCECDDTQAVVDLVTDVISIETGEEFAYDIEGGEDEEDGVEEIIKENPEYSAHSDLENF